MTQRTAVKTLSSLTLIIAGVAAAGSASAAASNGDFANDIAASTSIQADMQSLSISEFRDEKSALLADGHHHSDSFGSHHHHDTASKQMAFASRIAADSRFDV
ncbi:hypothetical protein NJG17_21740 [Stenotrophomonas maltophilia]|jgi:hypothetical protein|uniref:hypothetical protein n=1 Tax=Stenotrophomonas TaxID=40323 RepID=UPI00050A34CE|nr:MULTISPECIES: hypothetical protein [Stenotrophomonas]EKU9957816.1 hypothetical protein [Stenotrophomonas maltophilia]EKU9983549.1 hypothetical protein [Stenotrophomonas maltophilia]KGM25567.1 hypothetical protein LI87_0100295 [Stenotrophomonas maltophilia]MBA0421081.1 hypothetical protein [Stenotrophomonas maltophilia]MBH1493976.1 hypothetical protein [Stenotrophomonas maltophilia]